MEMKSYNKMAFTMYTYTSYWPKPKRILAGGNIGYGIDRAAAAMAMGGSTLEDSPLAHLLHTANNDTTAVSLVLISYAASADGTVANAAIIKKW